MASKKMLAVVVSLVSSTAACGDDGETASEDTEASTGRVVAQLTWDGTDCSHDDGSQDVSADSPPILVTPAGSVEIELVNTSDGLVNLAVVRLDEGYTADDVIALNAGDGSTRYGPDWMTLLPTGYPARGGETIRWEDQLDAGEYFLGCTRGQPIEFWYGGWLTVIDA